MITADGGGTQRRLVDLWVMALRYLKEHMVKAIIEYGTVSKYVCILVQCIRRKYLCIGNFNYFLKPYSL